jgi:very-short-patch-repair endonuclease
MSITEFVNSLIVDESQSRNKNTSLRGSYFKSILTKDILFEFIINQRLSANYICSVFQNKIKLRPGYIIELAKLYDIPTKNIKEQNSSNEVKERRKNTLLKRYGITHQLEKASPFYKQRNLTIQKKYGVNNVFQLNWVKEKSIKTLIDKYGVNHPIFLTDRDFSNGRRSYWHIKMEEMLDKNKIVYKSEYGNKEMTYSKHNLFLGRLYSPIVDIFIPSFKLVLEINSDYYHANPKIYADDEWIERWHGKVLASDVRLFDKFRKEQIESFGVKVVEIWVSDLKQNFKTIEKHILNLCNIK